MRTKHGLDFFPARRAMRLCPVALLLTMLAVSGPAWAQYTESTLAQFPTTADVGPDNNSVLTPDGAGNLVGTTSSGGDASDDGTVFQYNIASQTLSTVAPFAYTNGANPQGGVIVRTGALYGTASQGGTYATGTLFSVSGGTVTPLYHYTGGADGAFPSAGLAINTAQNLLFGTTSTAGSSNGSGGGTLFQYNLTSNSLTTLARFTGANGNDPEGTLVFDATQNNLYGTTIAGGNGYGTVFKFNVPTQTLTTLAKFAGTSNGAAPDAGVAIGPDGNLYGTTRAGGTSGSGTVFKYDLAASALSSLYSFTGGAAGASPASMPVFDSLGSLYGTTSGGGDAAGDGTVFKLNYTTKAITTLFTFNGTNGANPQAGLYRDAAGNLYGTTTNGGTNGAGTLFVLAVPVAAPEPPPLIIWTLGMAGLFLLRRRVLAANLT